MPSWSEILNELQQTNIQIKAPPFDTVRRKYLQLLYKKTGRNTILYATAWTKTGLIVHPDLLSITEEDIQGLMEVVHGLQGKELDLIIHSPGGSPEAAEAFVSYLRKKFDDIRVIIPYAAMSAATMISCSANKILMANHSYIGPIDPQMIIPTQFGLRAVPAYAILQQFDYATDDAKKDPKKLASWMPLLSQYPPGILIQCMNAIDLSEELVSKWLKNYMFKGKKDATKRAKKIANELSNHDEFKTHGRHIDKEQARKIGLEVEDLEKDQELQDLVLSVYHATTHTFGGTSAVKIIENHLGKAYVSQSQQISIQLPPIITQEQPPTKPSPLPEGTTPPESDKPN
ncbi:MAG: serine protease [Candidatus Nitrosotenuis sp.]